MLRKYLVVELTCLVALTRNWPSRAVARAAFRYRRLSELRAWCVGGPRASATGGLGTGEKDCRRSPRFVHVS